MKRVEERQRSERHVTARGLASGALYTATWGQRGVGEGVSVCCSGGRWGSLEFGKDGGGVAFRLAGPSELAELREFLTLVPTEGRETERAAGAHREG